MTLTPREHSHFAAVEQAAIWLSEQVDNPPHVIAFLRDKFGITATQAARACTMANQFRADRRPTA